MKNFPYSSIYPNDKMKVRRIYARPNIAHAKDIYIGCKYCTLYEIEKEITQLSNDNPHYTFYQVCGY